MKIKNSITIFILFLVCCQDESIEKAYNKLISNSQKDCLETINMHGYKNINKNYRKIFDYGKNINDFLLKKALSQKNTNYVLCPLNINLTDGDIAILLLLDINMCNDTDFSLLIPDEIYDAYDSYGAAIWWEWLKSNENNRIIILNLINKYFIN